MQSRRDRLFGGWRCVAFALLMLAGCQQPQVEVTDNALSQVQEACAAGDPLACRQLAQTALSQSAGGPVVHLSRPEPESRAAQIQRDVAAIIRGMERSSASNGL